MVFFPLLSGDSLADIKAERERSDTPDSIAGYEYMTLGKFIVNNGFGSLFK